MIEPGWKVKIVSPVTVTDGDYSPPAEWQPPYPYRWEQVLFYQGRLEE